MDAPGHEFLLADTGDAPAASEETVRLLRAALAERFGVLAGNERREDRVWLDTADLRLRAAGLRLAYVTCPVGEIRGAGTRRGIVSGQARGSALTRSSSSARSWPASIPGELLLAGTGGSSIRHPAALRWPSLLAGLPTGPVRERLGSVIGVRALLPLVEVTGTVRELALLNADEKTVVRARIEHASVGQVPLPVRITLTAVRGYTEQAERAAKLLTAVPGVTAAPPTELDLVVPAAPARRVAQVRPDQDATQALAVLLHSLLDEITVNTPGTLDDIDTEFLHDLRVAVRRTRSALKLAGDALPGGLAERFAGEFRWLGELTTPVRDLDTLLLGFDALADELTEADAADLEPLRAYLRRQRGVERRRLVRGLRSARFTELTSTWRAELVALLPKQPGETPAPGAPGARRRATARVAPLAAQRVGRAWRQVARRGAAVTGATPPRPGAAAGRASAGAGDGRATAGTPPEALHDLRKRCKELRYVLELFGAVWDPDAYRGLVKELKMLQDTLGEFQDAEVHRDRVRAYAAQMAERELAGVPTLLAMGELVARLGARQRAAAQLSVARVRCFVTKENRRRIATLAQAG